MIGIFVNSINWLGVALATVVAFISGAVWFGPKTFFPVWWKALGKPVGGDPGAGQSMGVVFGSTFVAVVVQAIVMGLVIGKLGESGEVSIAQGGLVGFILGVGIAAAPSLSHRLFGQQGFKVWLIEVASDVLNVTLMGLVIAAVS